MKEKRIREREGARRYWRVKKIWKLKGEGKKLGKRKLKIGGGSVSKENKREREKEREGRKEILESGKELETKREGKTKLAKRKLKIGGGSERKERERERDGRKEILERGKELEMKRGGEKVGKEKTKNRRRKWTKRE